MAESVCVGVPVHAEPSRLLDTLRQLTRYAGAGVSVVLLPDGPDEPTRRGPAQLGLP